MTRFVWIRKKPRKTKIKEHFFLLKKGNFLVKKKNNSTSLPIPERCSPNDHLSPTPFPVVQQHCLFCLSLYIMGLVEVF